MPLHRDPVVATTIDAAIEVHRQLGPGLLESTYEACLECELVHRGLQVVRQVAVPVVYKNMRLDCGYRLDLLIDGDVIVEIKSVEQLHPIHTAQVLTYLRLTGARQLLLFNFNSVLLKDGMRSFLGGGNYVPTPSALPRPQG